MTVESEVLLLFVGVLIVGLPVLLPTMHLAVQGEVPLWIVASIALTATWSSDAFWYVVGRSASNERLKRIRRLRPHLERAEAIAARSSATRLLFLSRFLYGTRIAANVFSGAGRMSVRTFAAVNGVSAVLWVGALFLLVFAVGSSLERIFVGSRAPHVIVTVLVLLAIGLRQLMVRAGRRAIDDADAADGWPQSVSVVIPAYNEEQHIEGALRSVRRQGVPAQIIVVENGSRDGTAAIARQHADVVLDYPERLGYSRARNVGAKVATGELLVFLDADSRMAPGALEAIVADVRRGAFGTVRGVPDPPEPRYCLFMATKFWWQRLGLYRGVLGGLLFCDRELFDRIGGFDEGLAIDELRRFTRDASQLGGKYSIVARARASTSMRRFANVGFLSLFWFWIRLRLGLEDGIDYMNLRHVQDSDVRTPSVEAAAPTEQPVWAQAYAGPERPPT